MALSADGSFNGADYAGYDCFEDAMAAVAAEMKTPVPWNEWQKMAAAVRESGYPNATTDRKMLAALRRVTMVDVFGKDWIAQAGPSPLTQRVLAAVEEEPAAGRGACRWRVLAAVEPAVWLVSAQAAPSAQVAPWTGTVLRPRKGLD